MTGAHSSETKRDEIAKGGGRWFFLMGPLAIVLTAWLYQTDRYLMENDKEEQKGNMLRELRTAQSSVGSVSYDDRQGGYSATSGGLSGLIKSEKKVEVVADQEALPVEPAENEKASAPEVSTTH